MRIVFADTLYWIALTNSRDQWHQRAVSINAEFSEARLVTTDSVLTELANFFAEYGEVMRGKVALAIRSVLSDEEVEVLSESRQTFLDGLMLFRIAFRQSLQPHRLHCDERHEEARHCRRAYE